MTNQNAAFARIKDATGARTQIALANILGIRQSTVSEALRRNSIPDAWLLTLLRKYNLNPDWILTGNGVRNMAACGVEFTNVAAQALPCPFCGDSYVLVSEMHNGEKTEWKIACTNTACPVVVELCTDISADFAVSIWNARA